MGELSSLEATMLYAVLGVALISLVYAYWLYRDTIRREKAGEDMQEVWRAIKAGANAYLGRQLKTILPILVGLAVIVFLSVYVVKPSHEAMAMFNNDVNAARLGIGLGRSVAFIVGAAFSLLVGQLGMRVVIEGNIRVAG